jgi:hypothetical protein
VLLVDGSFGARQGLRGFPHEAFAEPGFVLLVDRSLGARQGLRGFPHEAFAEPCKCMEPYSLDRRIMVGLLFGV